MENASTARAWPTAKVSHKQLKNAYVIQHSSSPTQIPALALMRSHISMEESAMAAVK
jgi:hypothetical protein